MRLVYLFNYKMSIIFVSLAKPPGSYSKQGNIHWRDEKVVMGYDNQRKTELSQGLLNRFGLYDWRIRKSSFST